MNKIKHNLLIYLWLLPILIFFILFQYLPIFGSIYMSLFEYNASTLLKGIFPFIGFRNYSELLHDTLFIASLKNTFYYAIGHVTLMVAVSLFFAVIFNSALRHTNLYRTVYFIPVVTSLMAVCMIWSWLYDEKGLINYMLRLVGLHGLNWLKNPRSALPCLMIFSVWKSFGFYMVIFAAGLRGIPETYYEAASIDGASPWAKFRHVTIPCLNPIILLVIIMATIGAFQVFGQIYAMTQGGPVNSTRTIVYHIYDEGFRFHNMGHASAAAIVLLVITGIVTLFQIRVIKGK